MDIFNRKKLAAAKAEIDRLEKACAKLQADISEVENRAEGYKRERDEVRSNIGKQVAKNGELTKSLSELRYLKEQKEKDEQVFKTEIEELKKKLKEAETLNLNLSLSLEQMQDRENVEDTTNNYEKSAYIIRDEVVYGRKIKNKKHEEWENYHGKNYTQMSTLLMSALYRNKKIYKKKRVEYFFSANEFIFFELLMPLIQSNELVLLSKVRLADIIELWEKFYNNEAKEAEKKQNSRDDEDVFLNVLKKNRYKRLINERMIELNPNFNHTDYKTAFLYPLLRLHIDFLICKRTDSDILPLLVFELNGEEHYKNSKSYDSDRIKNDELKQAIFRSDNVKIGFLTIYNDLLYEKRDELIKIMSDALFAVSDSYDDIDWKKIQNSLSELAKPYIEKLGK